MPGSRINKFAMITLQSVFFIYLLFSQELTDWIVAQVGQEVILYSELEQNVELFKAIELFHPISDSQLYAEVLKKLVDNKLLKQSAEEETIIIQREEIEEELENNWQLLKKRFPSEEEFRATLEREGISEKELKNRYREEIKSRLQTTKLLTKKGLTNILVTPTALKEFYEKHKDSIAVIPAKVSLAHIFLPVLPGEETELQAQKKISEIYDILVRGGDFEEVARSFSEDEKTKKRGGLLGNFKIEELAEEFKSVITNLKEGEFSIPFRSSQGYHILKYDKSPLVHKITVRHIFIRVQPAKNDTLQTKNLALRIRKKALSGEDFDSLAEIYSYDIQTKDQGGYLGEFFIDGLLPPFNEIVKKMSHGEISEPILSQDGFHIIKVIEKQEKRELEFNEVQNQIRDYLYQLELKKRLDEYLEKLKKKSFILINYPLPQSR